jgi:hypothetical protein
LEVLKDDPFFGDRSFDFEEALQALSKDATLLAQQKKFSYLKVLGYSLAAFLLVVVITAGIVAGLHTGGAGVMVAAIAWTKLSALVAGFHALGVSSAVATVLAYASWASLPGAVLAAGVTYHVPPVEPGMESASKPILAFIEKLQGEIVPEKAIVRRITRGESDDMYIVATSVPDDGDEEGSFVKYHRVPTPAIPTLNNNVRGRAGSSASVGIFSSSIKIAHDASAADSLQDPKGTSPKSPGSSGGLK